ncbi:MAG: hypothetical protein JNM14_08770 [Ferruginibacter sp.]|nr:hypothetical protein [Ferruginibacter sp.]
MKKLILSAVAIVTITASAQNNTAANIIEGGKVLAELVRVFKTPKSAFVQPPLQIAEKKDSCSVKSISDISIKNSTDKPLLVSVFRRNGNLYETGVISLKILPKNQETIYELKAGIYKIKYETEDEEDEKQTIREGEIKLIACTNVFKEIKN